MAKILIVDDEESDRLLAQAILARAGHETVFAEDGEEALQRYREGGIEVVVTDLHMPQVHGFEVISLLREDDDPPALVAISGTGQFQLQMAEALGARHTLSKPLNPKLLLDAVERALAEREEARQERATGGGE